MPVPFECVLAVRVRDAAQVENALHTAFDDKRPNPKREFFEIDPEQATAILELVQLEDVTPGATEEVGGEVEAVDLDARKRVDRRLPRPKLRFPDLNTPIGAEIEFHDGSATATVESATTVRYDGEEVYLTPLTRRLRGTDKTATPSFYWKFKGRTLRDIYNEVHEY